MSSADGDIWKNLDLQLDLLRSDSSSKQVKRSILQTILQGVEELPNWAEGKTKVKGQGEGQDSDDSSGGEEEEEGGDGQGPRDASPNRKDPHVSPQEVRPLLPPLIQCLESPVEKIRELSYQTLTVLFRKLHEPVVVKALPLLIPTLAGRLGGPEVVEGSEEVRLLGLKMMGVLLNRLGEKGKLNPFCDEWTLILAHSLGDDWHEVRKTACSLTRESARALKEVFHYQSERLNKGLERCLAHQQWRVRLEGVLAMGDVAIYGNHKKVEDFFHPLTSRLFDPVEKVRTAVVEVVGRLMREYVDRYSYWQRMLPILLTGLCDESETVRETAEKIWEKVGEQYLEENIQDYKDQVDFEIDVGNKKEGYPEDVKRPNFGCRLLTQRNFGKILPGVVNDITDWVESTRVKCAQLLYHLLLNVEEYSTSNAEQVVACILKSCLDPDPLVSNYVLKSARMLGFFVPFEITWKSLESRFENCPNPACLAAISAILEGVDEKQLRPLLPRVLEQLKTPETCRTLQTGKHIWLLKTADAIISKNCLELKEASDVFLVLITVLSMSQDAEVKAKAVASLHSLQVVSDLPSVSQLYSMFGPEVLRSCDNPEQNWDRVTPEFLLFCGLLREGGSSFIEENRIETFNIFKHQLGPNKDPEVRLKLFDVLASVLKEGGGSVFLSEIVKTIVHDILSPNLVWRAGKSASALRAAATSCLLQVVEDKLLPFDHEFIGDEVLPGLLPLLEDGFELNRLLATQCLGRLGELGRLKAKETNRIYPELLKRLDDAKDEVRVSACLALYRLFANAEENYANIFKNHLDFVADALLPHLDDEEENVQAAVAEAMRVVGVLAPALVIRKCEDFKQKHRSPMFCEAIIEILQEGQSPSQ